MALTLRAAITDNQTSFEVSGPDDLVSGDIRSIGDEYVLIRNANRGVAPGESDYWRVSADRGTYGTRKTAHDAGAAVNSVSFLEADLP